MIQVERRVEAVENCLLKSAEVVRVGRWEGNHGEVIPNPIGDSALGVRRELLGSDDVQVEMSKERRGQSKSEGGALDSPRMWLRPIREANVAVDRRPEGHFVAPACPA